MCAGVPPPIPPRPITSPGRRRGTRAPAPTMTAQLITDGVTDTAVPRHIAVTTSQQGVLKKNERERVLDDNWTTSVDLRGKSVWLQVEIAGGAGAPAIDSVMS